MLQRTGDFISENNDRIEAVDLGVLLSDEVVSASILSLNRRVLSTFTTIYLQPSAGQSFRRAAIVSSEVLVRAPGAFGRRDNNVGRRQRVGNCD